MALSDGLLLTGKSRLRMGVQAGLFRCWRGDLCAQLQRRAPVVPARRTHERQFEVGGSSGESSSDRLEFQEVIFWRRRRDLRHYR